MARRISSLSCCFGECHSLSRVTGSGRKSVYQLLRLNQRAKTQCSFAADQCSRYAGKNFANKNYQTFSRQLQEKIQDRLDKQEQIVLLLNRRGYSSFVMCRDCGYVLPCPNCDISLTLHMDTKTMRCHYCGHEERSLTAVLVVMQIRSVTMEQVRRKLKKN